MRTGAGVPDAIFAWLPWLRTAAEPTFAMPETATTTISPAVLEPVATVTVVDVVFAIRAVRTNTAIMFALVPHAAVPMRA